MVETGPIQDGNFDAIIVGAGAAGGIVAALLCEAGKRVLLLERGSRMGWADVSRDHLRNQRISRYGHNAGPDVEGNPRVAVDPNGNQRIVRPHEGGYQNNAAAVGGGTLVYGAQAWRFTPKDFQMASVYGTPPGSSLSDWPISYDELAPFYERAEWEIGVCGDGSPRPHFGARNRGYPMPPVQDNPQRRVMTAGAKMLGWDAAPVPLAINSIPFNGRDACVRCGSCAGFACPSDGKNGSQNTMLPRALKTGLCTLVTHAMTERIDTDDRGKVIGVTYLIPSPADGKGMARVISRAKVVVVSGAAVESARLLLNSSSTNHPRGLGNESDQVGRHLQGHYYPGALGQFKDIVYDGNGPGVSVSTCQFNHGNAGIVGGGMLANEFITLPIYFWYNAWPNDLPRWGAPAKQFMREGYRRVIHVQGPVQEIPSPDSRVMVDAKVRDRFGIPVAKISGTTHPETVRTSLFMRDKAEQWLKAAGAQKVWTRGVSLHISAGQHQAGTCRMGDDPKSSVTDKWGRVHAHDNLYVIDGSLHVTNGGFNPVLTIMALAFRCGEKLTKSI